MKKYILLTALGFTTATINAQSFTTNVSTAKTSYSSGKLEDTHFALQQMLVELDMTIGKEVLKLLPAKVDTLSARLKEDNVSGNIGFLGATIHRTYGTGDKKVTIDIVSNSPLVSTLNAFLTNPLLNIGNKGNSKVIKVQGYKARLNKEENGEKPAYRLEMPFNNALVTVAAEDMTEAQIMTMLNSISFSNIAKLIQ